MAEFGWMVVTGMAIGILIGLAGYFFGYGFWLGKRSADKE